MRRSGKRRGKANPATNIYYGANEQENLRICIILYTLCIMSNYPISITVYDKRLEISWDMYVERLEDNLYRATENELFGNITIGTEFRTWINKEGKHQIVKIVKHSPYFTRRFMMSSGISESDYRLLGDEIVRHGGYWQTDMGSIITVSLPLNCDLDIDDLFRIHNHWPTEIKNDL